MTSQNLSITNPNGPGSVYGCSPSSNFTFNVNNAPNNFDLVDVVHLNFVFAQGIELNQVSSSAGNLTVNGNAITVSNVGGINTFEIQYSINLNCNFPSNNTVLNTHIINYSLNATTPQTFNYNSPYACTQSALVFDGGTNLNFNNALLNTPFTRTYVFKNSSNVPFTGNFTFDDNAFYPANDATYNFSDISLALSVNVSTITSSSTNQNAHIELQIANLQQGQSFTITETGQLLECSGAVDYSKTVFTAMYGCNTNDQCRSVESSSIALEATARVSQAMPVVQFTNDQHLENCINTTTHRTYTITNVGNGPANKASFEISRGGFGPLLSDTYFIDEIDQNSLSATINGNPAAVAFSTFANGYYARITVTGNIQPQDIVVIQYDEVFNCIPEASYNDYFNKTAILHNLHPQYVSLTHPCLGETGMYTGPFISHPQELKQTFNNLNGQMLGAPPSSAWFHIDNSTPLILGNYLTPFSNNQTGAYLVPYNLANAEFEVRLKLETGLRLTNNSDFYLTSLIGATTVTINPLPSDVNNPNTGQGDIVTAKFHFPSNWCTPYAYNGHNYWATTTEFNQFFNSFKVNFQLEANCINAPVTGIVHITEQCFINPTPSCSDCKLPLCEVSELTNINCPGCVTPGWNITSFDIKRLNVGYEDTDNNHLHDTPAPVLASTADVNTSAAMIGDIIEGSITGFLSDGQDFGVDGQGNQIPVGFTFASAGFSYTEGLLNFVGNVVQHLEFIGATGTITLSNGNQSAFAITASDILPQTSCIGIPMSIQDLIGYGAQGLSDYSNITNITLYPRFKIIHNLTDGSGNANYISRAINCFYHIGANEFTDACSNFPDAGGNIADLLDHPEIRPNYQYRCTAFEGRFMGVGVDLRTTNLIASQKTHINNDPSISLCSKEISYNYWVSVGDKYSVDPQNGPMNQTSANIFSKEIRSIGTLDKLTFNFPSDYEPDKITFHNFDAGYDLQNNVHNWYHDAGQTFNYPVYDINGNPTNSVSIGTNSITIYPSNFISTLPLHPLYGIQYYSAFEENQYYVVKIHLRPKDCNNISELSDFNNNTIQTEFLNYPLNTVTQTTTSIETINVSDLKNGLSFRNPNPVLTLTTPSGLNTIGNLVFWDVALTTDAVDPSPEPIDEAIIRSAENTFVSFVSPSGNFSNINIGGNVTTFYNASSTQAPPVTIPGWATNFSNQSAGYALDFVGYNYNSDQIVSKQFKINADFNCANLTPGATDFITVYKGWNCFNSPNSVLSACKHDSVNLYFTVPETDVQISFQHESSVSACSTTTASITFDPIIGITQSAVVELQSSPAGAYNYISGSAYFTNDDGNGGTTTTYIEPTFSNGVWTWNLNSLGGIFSQPAVLYYQLQTSCGFESGQTIQHVTAKNSCGLVITDLPDTWSPQFISNLPEPDLIELAVDDINLSSCQNNFSLQLTITNTGNNVTAGNDYIIFPLPNSISYAGNNSNIVLVNNELQIDVPANISSGNNFIYTIPVSYAASTCTTISLEFSVTHNLIYNCGNDTCAISSSPTVIETSNINVNLPVYTVSNINTDELCNGGNTLHFSLNSNGATINDITTVSIIDLVSGNVLGSVNITLPFINTEAMSVVLNGFSNNLGFVFSGCNCNTIIEYAYSCPPCNADAGADVTICEGNSATLNASGGNTYLWMPGGGNTASINVNPLQTTTYILTTTNGNSTCTDEVTVFVNPLPEIIVTGQDSVCKGQNSTILTANMIPAGGNFVWTIPPSNTPISNSNILNTGLLGSSVVYAVSATLNGCTSNTTYPVTVVGSINISLTASATEICSGDNLILTANGAGLNGTYLWNPQPISISSNGSQATYAPSQTTIYTVIGTNSIGCEDENTITVTVGNCLCEGNEVPTTIGPNTQNNFSGDVFAISANTNVNTNTLFEDASIVFTGAYTLFVNSGATLTINHAHLWACENMWNGIKVLPGGKLVIKGNSLIEDADSAICVHNPIFSGANNPILDINGSTFNKNFTGITISNYNSNNPNYPFNVIDAVFTKRDITFATVSPFTTAANPWPSTNSYKVIVNSGTINEHCAISNTTSIALKSPHISDNSKYGIRVNNIGNINNNWNANNIIYKGIFIGGTGKYSMNLYDNLETGIYAMNSNFTNINSTFQYMVSVNSTPTINDADGIGIFAFKTKGIDNMYKATILEGLLFQNVAQKINKFYDTRYGVLIKDYAATEIKNSDIRSTQIAASGNLGSIGFDIVTSKYKLIAINSNTITNVRYGINFTGHQNSVFGPVTIDNNIIQAHYPNLPFLSSQFVRQGIFALTYSIVNPIQSNTIVSTSNNILLDVDNGIITSQWKALKSVSNNNYIRMIYRLGALSNQIGIEHSDNHFNEIINNQIEDDPNSSTLYNVDGYKGIYSKLCFKENIKCNVITKLGNGIEFNFNHFNNVNFSNNTFENNYKGYVLSNNANIGNQFNATTPSDNKWINFGQGTFHTFVNSSNPLLSILYIRNIPSYQPIQNGAAIGSTAYSLNTSLLNITNNPHELICNTASHFVGNKIANCDNCSENDINIIDQIQFDYVVFPNPSRGIFTIKSKNNTQNDFSLKIYNVLGELIRTINTKDSNSKIDISDQPPGAYLLNITTNSNVNIKKTVILMD
jgi:hypothetical protein